VRPWRLRLTLRRSRIQWALLSVVLLVSILSATLLATLFLLSTSTETFAARAALRDAPAEDIRVVQRVTLRDELEPVTEGAAEATATLFADIPFTTSLHAQGDILEIHRDDEGNALGYFASIDDIADVTRLDAGRWPASGNSREATIPTSLMEDLGLELGEAFDVSPLFRRDDTTPITVVGTYTVREPDTDFWRFDRMGGQSYDPNYPLPLSGGLIRMDAYGPLISDIETVSAFGIGDVTVTSVPAFADVSLDQATELLGRVDDLEATTTRGIGIAGNNVRVSTVMDVTLGGVIGSLAVTRSSVLVTGLLLLVLSVAALGQTARLMAERRYSELHLMVARGGSGRQVFRLALTEAIVLGAITAGVSPWLARYGYQAIASQEVMTRAGMDQDPGLPVWIWTVTGVVGFVLMVVLVAPLLKRTGSFVDSEQARSRPGKRAAFQRSGLDVALVVLAALAYWQLRSYESPVIADGGIARLDPLLAAGPALALLAGSLVAVRLIPAASKALEGLAARGRRAVMPLAAWEVGRRSARAVSAILLLTLAVSVGTFAMSYLTTWQLSQQHQAQYQHPADLMVSGLSGPSITQSATLASDRVDITVSPGMIADAVISPDVEQSLIANDGLSGDDVKVFATDDTGLEFYAEGRLGSEFGANLTNALTTRNTASSAGFELPGQAAGLEMLVTATTPETALNNITVTLRAVLEDGNGQIFTVDMGSAPADGEEHRMRAPFVEAEFVDRLALPISLVGLQSVWFADDRDTEAAVLQAEGRLPLTLSVDGIGALDVSQVMPVAGVGPAYSSTPVEEASARDWNAINSGVGITSLAPTDDQIRAELFALPNNLRFRAVALTQSAEPALGPIPIVPTANLANRLNLEAGDPVLIQIGGAVIEAIVQDTTRLLPEENIRQEAILANADLLALAMIQAGSPSPEVNRWWVGIDDTDIAAYTRALPDQAEVTGRAELATSFMEDPLRIASQAALWLVTGAAVILAAVGFAVHAVVTVRARHIEFAQLRAVGVQRGQLLRVVSGEALLLSVLGVVFGVTLGVALGYLVAPLVAVGADGRPPLPSVVVDIPWATVGLLALEVAAVLALTVFLVGLMLRRINPAQLLRLGD
jgi:hypothetical protein